VRELYGFRNNNEVNSKLLNTDLKKAGKVELTRLIKALASKSVPAHTILLYGVASHEILKTAKDLSSDMILISSLGRTGWKRALLGSTTEEVVRHASCPVLVFRQHKRN